MTQVAESLTVLGLSELCPDAHLMMWPPFLVSRLQPSPKWIVAHGGICSEGKEWVQMPVGRRSRTHGGGELPPELRWPGGRRALESQYGIGSFSIVLEYVPLPQDVHVAETKVTATLECAMLSWAEASDHTPFGLKELGPGHHWKARAKTVTEELGPVSSVAEMGWAIAKLIERGWIFDKTVWCPQCVREAARISLDLENLQAREAALQH